MTYTDKTSTRNAPNNRDTAPASRSASAREGDRSARTNSDNKQVAPHEREQMIATAAYFRAAQRGFTPGNEVQDWLQAEAEVDRRLRGTDSAASPHPRTG